MLSVSSLEFGRSLKFATWVLNVWAFVVEPSLEFGAWSFELLWRFVIGPLNLKLRTLNLQFGPSFELGIGRFVRRLS